MASSVCSASGSETVTIEQAGVPPTPPTPANVIGSVTCDGVGVPGVLISDGIEIVETDANGNYRLLSDSSPTRNGDMSS